MSLEQFVPFVPEIFLALAGFALLLGGITGGRRVIKPLSLAAVASLGVTMILVWLFGRPEQGPELILGGMLVIDQFAVCFKLLLSVAAAIALLMAAGYLERSPYGGGEFSSLVLFATLGMFVMVSGANVVSLYVGLELMALSVYVLVGYFKLEAKSNEGAVKYFVLGALSSGILLYGFSLLYGSLGTLDLGEIRAALPLAIANDNVLTLAILLIGFGMLFKVAAVPFHVWTPDAYEGAPTPITAFMSVGPKAAAFAMFMRLFLGAFFEGFEQWGMLIWIASALTMIYGNVAALTQDNVKRMLAYSSIAHAGYALMGILAASAMGAWSVLMYMLVYTFMNMGAFGLVILLESKGYAGEKISDFAGLSRRHPAAAAAMLIFMLALAGIPPTAGFMGKLYVFGAAVQAGYIKLVVIGFIMSAVSLFYYFRIVMQMYFKESEAGEATEMHRDRWVEVMVAACAVITLLVGIYPAPVVAWAQGGLNALGLL
ncbi:MAG: NADH-quinone oxidoreductase subunit N [bacterium]|nr:NADH-quinone oxidoreductase subunit N [bacterium]